MLESLAIKNFRSCDDVEIRLAEPIVAFVGKNGVGKTNLLHALQLTADLCVGEPGAMFSLSPRERTKPTEFCLTFALAGSRYIYRIIRTSPPAKPEIFEEYLKKDSESLFRRVGEMIQAPLAGLPDGLRVGTTAAALPTLLQILPEGNPCAAELRPVSEYLRAIRYYPLLQGFQEHSNAPFFSRGTHGDFVSDSSPIIEAYRYETWKTDLSQGRARRSVQMRILHMGQSPDKPWFSELKTLLGENGLGLIADVRIEEVQIRRQSKDKAEEAFEPAFAISFMPGSGLAGSGRWFRFSGLSAGTWRILQLLTYLVFDKNSCMLLEQPEDCIHAGLLSKITDILSTYSTQTQLICTTHSPRVMNLVGAKGIRFVSAEAGKTTIGELGGTQLESASKYLADEGTLAEFLETL